VINLNTIRNLFGIIQKIGIKIIIKIKDLIQFRGRFIEELGSKTENRFDIIIFINMGLRWLRMIYLKLGFR